MYRFIGWVASFAIAWAAHAFLGAEQGIVFLVCWLVCVAAFLVVSLSAGAFSSLLSGDSAGGGAAIVAWNAFWVIGVTLAALAVSYLATFALPVDFWTALMLVTLGQCLMYRITIRDRSASVGTIPESSVARASAVRLDSSQPAVQGMPAPQAKPVDNGDDMSRGSAN